MTDLSAKRHRFDPNNRLLGVGGVLCNLCGSAAGTPGCSDTAMRWPVIPWPLYSATLVSRLHLTNQVSQYAFYGTTGVSLWYGVKHGYRARLWRQFGASTERHWREFYACKLWIPDTDGLHSMARQVAVKEKRTAAVVAAFGVGAAVTNVAYNWWTTRRRMA